MFFLCALTAASPAPREQPLNPTDHEYLFRQNVWFQAQDAEVQNRYRRLHAAFEALPPDDQNRLTRVLQNYQSWLARLPDADRQKIYKAPDGTDRLALIRQLREQEWVATLPLPYRQEYAAAPDEARRQKVAAWRAEEAERHEDWDVARRNWPEFLPGRLPKDLPGDSLALVERFVENLKPTLGDEERRRLDLAKATIQEQGAYYYPYLAAVANMADAHPLCPGRVGPKDFASLPDEVQKYLGRQGRLFRSKGAVLSPGGEDAKELRRSVGRWPDFGIELTKYCHKHGLTGLPPLGECREDEMPPEVREALRKLRDQAKRSGEVKAQLEQLEKAQGTWPEYPLKVVEVCRKNQVPLPGWTLPGPPKVWDNLRAGRGKLK